MRNTKDVLPEGGRLSPTTTTLSPSAAREMLSGQKMARRQSLPCFVFPCMFALSLNFVFKLKEN